MIHRRMLAIGFSSFVAAATCLSQAIAQPDYPTRPVKVVIPNPPGGPGDVITRTVAEKATQSFGQPFVFEYQAGASTRVGTYFVARAEPDGYTILGFPSSGLTNTVLRKDLPYDLERDFEPIIGIGSIPLALVVRTDSQFKTINDLANAARQGNITYGSGGPGTIAHLTSARFLNELKGKGTHVPFRGNPDALQGVMGGHIDFFFASIGDVAGFTGSNGVRVLAVTANERVAELADAPTMSELGFPNFNPNLWYALPAPKGTPDHIVTRLYSVFSEAVKDAAVQKRLSTIGFRAEARDPKAVSDMMKDEAVRCGKVVQENDIKVGN